MMTTTLRVFLASFLSMLLVGTIAVAADADQETVHDFEFKIASTADMDVLGKKQKIVADTDLFYNWTSKGRERTLRFTSMTLKVSIDGKELMNTDMRRPKFTNTTEGKTQVIELANAPEALKKILLDSFDAPVCKREVDETGKELKRTIVAGPGAKSLIDNGMIANAIFFHPPILRDQDQWQADTEISIGNGGYAKGKLTYQKIKDGKDGQAVKVSGTLTNDSYKQPGSPLTLKKLEYVVNGEQTYNPAQREWISGKLTINLTYQMIDSKDDKAIGSTKGTMVVSFKKLPGKK